LKEKNFVEIGISVSKGSEIEKIKIWSARSELMRELGGN
jgi:hypothetical protein